MIDVQGRLLSERMAWGFSRPGVRMRSDCVLILADPTMVRYRRDSRPSWLILGRQVRVQYPIDVLHISDMACVTWDLRYKNASTHHVSHHSGRKYVTFPAFDQIQIRPIFSLRVHLVSQQKIDGGASYHEGDRWNKYKVTTHNLTKWIVSYVN